MHTPKVNRQTFGLYLVALLSALVLAACGGGGGSDSGSSGTGTVAVSLTDAPACGFDAVNVTVRQVRIHRRDDAEDNEDGWTNINLDPPRKINLLDLNNGVAQGLGEAPLGAGTYLQIRLVLVANSNGVLANSVVPSGTGTEIALDTPSAKHSGLKLVNRFTVPPNERMDLLLDFDACKSVVKRGHDKDDDHGKKGAYSLKPVIKVIPLLVTMNGIKGVIAPALLGSNVVISVQRDGQVVHSTVPNPQTGEFLVAPLDSGTYDLVVTGDGRATAQIQGVPVASSSSVATVGTTAQPITLPTSTTHTISGVVTLDPASPDTVIFVTAKQTIAAGGSVTVKTTSADLLNGMYALTLPAGAPLHGTYGTGALPIALTPAPTAAGQYLIEGSAAGYTTQSVTRNLASADATQNATLVP